MGKHVGSPLRCVTFGLYLPKERSDYLPLSPFISLNYTITYPNYNK